MKREDNFVLKPEVLDAHCAKNPDRTRLMILNYPNNPTGTCMKKEELRDIARICRKYDIMLFSVLQPAVAERFLTVSLLGQVQDCCPGR